MKLSAAPIKWDLEQADGYLIAIAKNEYKAAFLEKRGLFSHLEIEM